MRTIFTIFANIILTVAFGQKIIDDNCFANQDLKTKITRQTYPFNIADRILLVKYKALAVQRNPNYFSWDTVQIIPKKDGKIDTTAFLQQQQLTQRGVDSLLTIINQRSKEDLSVEQVFIEPSNAILFVDKQGNIYEQIVVCFTQFDKLIDYSEMTSSSKVSLKWWCKSKGKSLAGFFVKRGVDIIITKWY